MLEKNSDVMAKVIVGIVAATMLMLIAQIIRYFVNQ